MANLYTSAPYKGRPDELQESILMRAAEQTHDWETLKPYPALLTVWQARHKEDVMPIAHWVSHFRTPFIQSDLQTITVTVKPEKKLPYDLKYIFGADHGHKLCKPNCGECDYITGELVREPLPF